MITDNELKNKINTNDELRKVSTEFVLEMVDRINAGYAARDITINKMSESIDKLSNVIKESVNNINIKPTREDLQDDIKDLRNSLIGDRGFIIRLSNDLIGKNGMLTKIYNYIKAFLLILTLTGGIAVVILELIKYFEK